MKELTRYHLTRAPFAAALGALIVGLGQPWYLGVAVGLGVLIFFLWAPHSGRYLVRSGVAPMRRDERTRAVAGAAARFAFGVTTLALAGLTLFLYLADRPDVPAPALLGIIALGWIAYLAAEFRQGRA